eukprot:GEZU01019215.1.p1 GENE.GEZU01019215.1~~GEZU01019215.1.p1  ORF type:complete len:599 (+),score=216.15 GEZU01019215.1:39-1835(+)
MGRKDDVEEERDSKMKSSKSKSRDENDCASSSSSASEDDEKQRRRKDKKKKRKSRRRDDASSSSSDEASDDRTKRKKHSSSKKRSKDGEDDNKRDKKRHRKHKHRRHHKSSKYSSSSDSDSYSSSSESEGDRKSRKKSHHDKKSKSSSKKDTNTTTTATTDVVSNNNHEDDESKFNIDEFANSTPHDVVKQLLQMYPESSGDLANLFAVLDRGECVVTVGIADTRVKKLLELLFTKLSLVKTRMSDGTPAFKRAPATQQEPAAAAEEKEVGGGDSQQSVVPTPSSVVKYFADLVQPLQPDEADEEEKTVAAGPSIPDHILKALRGEQQQEEEATTASSAGAGKEEQAAAEAAPPAAPAPRKVLGPALPTENERILIQSTINNPYEPGFVGPAFAADQLTEEQRAMMEAQREIRAAQAAAAAAAAAQPKREEWMMDLPEDRAPFSFGPRTFRRNNTLADMKRRDTSWTEGPGSKKQGGGEDDQDAERKKDDSYATSSAKRKKDKEAEELVSKYNEKFRNKSLLELHEEKLKKAEKERKKKEKEDRKKGVAAPGPAREWRGWDRERDMAVNMIDPKKRSQLIASASALNSRFASGTSKFI